MKMSSRKTMLTAAVLVTLSSGTTYAATPGTVDSQDLFHANRLVTDPAKNPAVEEAALGDPYEASISGQKKKSSVAHVSETATVKAGQPAHLRWESVDARLAARNNEPSFNLSAQKPKPVIITAEDIRREEKLAAKEGRPPRELVGDVNMNRPVPPPKPKKPTPPTGTENYVDGGAADTFTPSVSNAISSAGRSDSAQESAVSHGMYTPSSASERHTPEQPSAISGQMYTPSASPHTGAQISGSAQHGYVPQEVPPNTVTSSMPSVPSADIMQQAERMAQDSSTMMSPASSVSTAAITSVEQRPSRSRYPQLPQKEFSLTPSAENSAVLDSTSIQGYFAAPVKDVTPAVEHSVRPEGVPALYPQQVIQNEDDLASISDEVRRHILAGQLAMEIQLQRDPSVAGMRAITKVLSENTTLTHLQKIDFLIGFGRALHRSGLPRQQEALLIKTIAESF